MARGSRLLRKVGKPDTEKTTFDGYPLVVCITKAISNCARGLDFGRVSPDQCVDFVC